MDSVLYPGGCLCGRVRFQSFDRPDAPELEPVSHSFEDGKPTWA